MIEQNKTKNLFNSFIYNCLILFMLLCVVFYMAHYNVTKKNEILYNFIDMLKFILRP